MARWQLRGHDVANETSLAYKANSDDEDEDEEARLGRRLLVYGCITGAIPLETGHKRRLLVCICTTGATPHPLL